MSNNKLIIICLPTEWLSAKAEQCSTSVLIFLAILAPVVRITHILTKKSVLRRKSLRIREHTRLFVKKVFRPVLKLS